MKKTKSALLLSTLALLVSISMFVGSTFAWFTDSVSSVNNIIKSGNLDIEVEYKLAGDTAWTALDVNTSIFDEEDLWEPGHTVVGALRVRNVGSLAAKINVATSVVSEKASINVNDQEFKLSDYLEVYTGDVMAADRNEVTESMTKSAFGEIMFADEGLESGESREFAIAITMPTTVGNEANHKTGVDAPKITFGITVNATQLMHEYDSFGNDYDEDAAFDTIVTNAAELKAALDAGKTPKLPDGSIYEEPEDAIVVWDTAELKSALVKANNGKTVFLAAGEFTLPQISKTDVKDITVTGTSLAKVTGMTVYKTNVFNNYTFENLNFTGAVKAVFYGNCVFRNCDFAEAGITNQSKVNQGATLTVEDCTFSNAMDVGALWFQGTVSTVNVRNCVFTDSAIVFGKNMTVTMEDCDYNASQIRCYGSVTVLDSTFDSECMVWPSASAAVDVTITMNGCSVDNGDPLTSICYFSGNPQNLSMQFVIDGTTIAADQMQMNPNA